MEWYFSFLGQGSKSSWLSERKDKCADFKIGKGKNMSPLFTCEEVAERYKVKVITVWEWIRQKKLGAIKLGREYRITEDDLVAFENSRRVKTE